MKIRRVAILGAAGAVLATGAIVAAHPSLAAAECFPGAICRYTNTNFRGTNYVDDIPALRDTEFYDDSNDSTSSIDNATTTEYCFFEHANFQGRSIRLGPGEKVANLDELGMDNAISSDRECSKG